MCSARALPSALRLTWLRSKGAGCISSSALLSQSSFTFSALPSLPPVRTKVTKPGIDYEINQTALTGILQKQKGKIYDKKPFKFRCEKGKSYLWCACGWSHTQPFCDGTHKNKHYRITMKPVCFLAPETKEYIFCNCKQTSKRPFCDGTHKNDEIQAAIK